MENNMNGMDALKQDFEILTRKIKSQKIDDSELIRSVMKHRMRWIDRYLYAQVFLLIPFAGLLWWELHRMGLVSISMAVVSVLLVAVSSVVDIRINKVIGKDWLKEDLLASRMTLLKMKKARARWMFCGTLLVVVWFMMLIADFYLHTQTEMPRFYGLMGSSVVGGAIGYWFGYSVYKKMQRTNDELIGEIDRFTADGE